MRELLDVAEKLDQNIHRIHIEMLDIYYWFNTTLTHYLHCSSFSYVLLLIYMYVYVYRFIFMKSLSTIPGFKIQISEKSKPLYCRYLGHKMFSSNSYILLWPCLFTLIPLFPVTIEAISKPIELHLCTIHTQSSRTDF